MAAPVTYTPLPFAGERYRPNNGRLIDIALARSAAIADSARQSGNISALMYGRAGEFAAKTLGEIAQMGPAERARQVEAARYQDTLERQQRAEQLQRDEMAQRTQEREAEQRWRQEQFRNTQAGASADDMRPGVTLSPDAFAAEQAGTASARRFSHDPATDGYGVLEPEASPNAMPERYTRQPNFAEAQAAAAAKALAARSERDDVRADAAARSTEAYRAQQGDLARRRTAATEAGARDQIFSGPDGPVLVDRRTGQSRPVTGADGQPLKKTAGSSLPEGYKQAFDRAILSVAPLKRAGMLQTANDIAANGTEDDLKGLIRQAAVEGENVDVKNQILGRLGTIQALTDAKAILAKIPTNILRGKWEDVMRALGKTSNPEYVRLAQNLQDVLINYRRAATGAQFGEAEAKDYAKMFATYTNEPPVNIALIDGLLEAMTNRDRTYWEYKLGPDGAKLIGASKKGKNPF